MCLLFLDFKQTQMLCINASVDEIQIKPKLVERLISFQKVWKGLNSLKKFKALKSVYWYWDYVSELALNSDIIDTENKCQN